jgi:hypothetical protein
VGGKDVSECSKGGNGAYTAGEINLLTNQKIFTYVGGRNDEQSVENISLWTALTGG